MQKPRLRTVVFLLNILLLAACTPSQAQPTPTLVPTPVTIEKPVYEVQRGTVTRTATIAGRVSPVVQNELYFRQDGFVQQVLVEDGDSVTAGQLLARLDEPERYQADIAAAQLAYARAEYDLEQAKLEAPVRLAEAQLALQQAELDLAEVEARRAAMDAPRVRDDLTIEDLQADVNAAEVDLAEAQARFDKVAGRPLNDPARKSALESLLAARTRYYRTVADLNWATGQATEADISLADAEVSLAQAVRDQAAAEVTRWSGDGLASTTSSTRQALRLAELTQADAAARLDLALKALENIELTAPFSGQVTAVGIVPGSSVSAFQAVMTLSDPSALEIRAAPDYETLMLLGVGQAGIVRLSDRPGEELPLHVSAVPLGGAQDDAGGDRSVHFALDDPAVSLQAGSSATIVMVVDQRDDVLWLPPAAIRSFQEQDFVYVQVGGVQRRVNVSLGLRSAERVEVLSGLSEGQTVVGE